jgi:lysyl-tRNA synthetase, class II
MTTTAVESSTLRSIRYDADRKLLQLEFHNYANYQYFHVPAEIYEGLLQAPSKGMYFNRFIREKFAYSKIRAASSS